MDTPSSPIKDQITQKEKELEDLQATLNELLEILKKTNAKLEEGMSK